MPSVCASPVCTFSTTGGRAQVRVGTASSALLCTRSVHTTISHMHRSTSLCHTSMSEGTATSAIVRRQ
eukprot:4998078-Amphidinium_carterae.1